jgi:hypothetical protein
MSDLPTSLPGSGSLPRVPAPERDPWLTFFREGARQCAEMSYLSIAYTALSVEDAATRLQRDLKALLDSSLRSSDWGVEDQDFDAAMAEATRGSFDKRIMELAQHPLILKGLPQ